MDLAGDDDDSNDSEVNMAECGACRAVIPIDSTSCPECSVSFSGVADDDMGECGACGTLVPIDSKSCSQCGVHFVLDDLTTALSIWMKDEGLTITELFGMVDADDDGSLTSAEVKGALLDRNLAFLGADELDRFLTQIDLNDDGVISFPELAAALSMPWTPPEDTAVLEPEEDEVEEVEDDSDSDDESDDDDSEDEEEDSDEEEEDSDEEEEDSDEDEDEEQEDSDEDDEDENEDEDDSEDEEDDSDDDSNDEEAEDDESDDDVAEDDESSEDSAPASEGPAEWQRFLMRNYENAFPILYTVGAIFIGLWLVNAMGILVDGSGGPIAYDGSTTHQTSMVNDDGLFETTTIQPGEIYPCDKEIQQSGCKNSLTPFAGENGASSMPAGFYWDGILFMVLGFIGLGGIGYLQMQIKQMRDEHRRSKKSESSDDVVESDEDSDDDDLDDDDSDDDDSDDDDSDDDDSDDDDSDDDDSDDDDQGDEIEIGTHVGVDDGDDEWFGVVVEFDDDDEDVVIVKRDDDGEEYEVGWDSLFLQNDD